MPSQILPTARHRSPPSSPLIHSCCTVPLPRPALSSYPPHLSVATSLTNCLQRSAVTPSDTCSVACPRSIRTEHNGSERKTCIVVRHFLPHLVAGSDVTSRKRQPTPIELNNRIRRRRTTAESGHAPIHKILRQKVSTLSANCANCVQNFTIANRFVG